MKKKTGGKDDKKIKRKNSQIEPQTLEMQARTHK